MKPVADSFCTVITGQWNPYIFRPDWVEKHLNIGKQRPAEVAYPIGDPSLPPRVRIDDIFVFPTIGRLDVRTPHLTSDGLKKTTAIADICLRTLCHTPITGLGINVAFSSDAEEAAKVVRLFSFGDDSDIDSSVFELQAAEIKRSFKVEDYALNLGIVFSAPSVKLEFNYHFECKNSEAALAFLEKYPSDTLYEKALSFIKNTYHMELEKE